MHPLAGQGLNLGLQDVAALLEEVRAREPFRDIGDAVLLRRYERDRAEPVAMAQGLVPVLARPGSLVLAPLGARDRRDSRPS